MPRYRGPEEPITNNTDKERQKMKRPEEGDRIADLDPSNNQEVEHVNSKQILDFPSQKQLRELYQGIHRRDQIFLCTETVRSTCVNKHSTSKRKTFNQILSQLCTYCFIRFYHGILAVISQCKYVIIIYILLWQV